MDTTYLNMNDPFHRHVHNPLQDLLLDWCRTLHDRRIPLCENLHSGSEALAAYIGKNVPPQMADHKRSRSCPVPNHAQKCARLHSWATVC